MYATGLKGGEDTHFPAEWRLHETPVETVQDAECTNAPELTMGRGVQRCVRECHFSPSP
jgi:hypothetical protein